MFVFSSRNCVLCATPPQTGHTEVKGFAGFQAAPAAMSLRYVNSKATAHHSRHACVIRSHVLAACLISV